MAKGMPRWLTSLWRTVDDNLKEVANSLRKKIRFIRLLRASTVAAMIVALGAAGYAVWRPEHVAYAFAAAVVALVLPLAFFFVIWNIPLQAKSLIRLIEKGYPANAREIAIRVAARKMRDQSIETEELIVETAWNESKKLLRKYQQRAERVKQELDEDEAASPPPATPPSP